MKTNRVVLVTALLVGAGVVVATRSGGTTDPDEKFAGHVEKLCVIARDGAGEPVAGVKRLGTYLADHAGDMYKDFVDTVALIERIPDDEEHDDRARVAHETMLAPLVDCIDDVERFVDAIERSDEASQLVERTAERIDRTLQIIGGGLRTTLKGRKLPAQLFPLRR
jgi:hypothetical protein